MTWPCSPSSSLRKAADDARLLSASDTALWRSISGSDSTQSAASTGRAASRTQSLRDRRAERIRADLERERSAPAYAKAQAAAATRRDKAQSQYVDEFGEAVRKFLDFPLQYHELATQFARLVTEHATPVGSGTVARTERIPVARRAESAVIAWLRHHTTAYDNMHIARVRGRRRETRRMLAERSRELLDEYRAGRADEIVDCPLRQALANDAAASEHPHNNEQTDHA